MIVINLGASIQPAKAPTGLTDPTYERRCLINDAERAAKMGSNPKTSCFWPEGSLHYYLWMNTYFANVSQQ